MKNQSRWFAWTVGIFLAAPTGAVWAQEAPTGVTQQQQAPAVEARFGGLTFSGTGDVSSDSQELLVRAQKKNLFDTPLLVFGRGKVGQQQFQSHDLHVWGEEVGAGWVLDPATDLLLGYRHDSYSTFNLSPDSDPAYRDAAGRHDVAAFGLTGVRDRRDDDYFPTRGYRAQLGGELAVRGWGGDYSFGRLGSDFAAYFTPWRDRAGEAWWSEITFVEHLRLGWMESFGASDEVPYFERYVVGGGNTVRGHRGDWLSPRRIDDQFIGGEAQFVNNVEARLPILKEKCCNRLSAALFFDMGRSYRRFSHFGDLGFGAGAGLRYIVHFWQIHGVLRLDYGVNLAPEDDDSRSRLHVIFGSPF